MENKQESQQISYRQNVDTNRNNILSNNIDKISNNGTISQQNMLLKQTKMLIDKQAGMIMANGIIGRDEDDVILQLQKEFGKIANARSCAYYTPQDGLAPSVICMKTLQRCYSHMSISTKIISVNNEESECYTYILDKYTGKDSEDVQIVNHGQLPNDISDNDREILISRKRDQKFQLSIRKCLVDIIGYEIFEASYLISIKTIKNNKDGNLSNEQSNVKKLLLNYFEEKELKQLFSRCNFIKISKNDNKIDQEEYGNKDNYITKFSELTAEYLIVLYGVYNAIRDGYAIKHDYI